MKIEGRAVRYFTNRGCEPVRGFYLGECPAFKDVNDLIPEFLSGWRWVTLSSTKGCSSITRSIVACLDLEGGWVVRTPHAGTTLENDGDVTTLVDYFADWIAADSKRLGEWVALLYDSDGEGHAVTDVAPPGLYYALLARAQRRLARLEVKIETREKAALVVKDQLVLLGNSVGKILS